MLKPRYKEDTEIEVGIDEAGRGCFWGPLIAGAVIWLPESEWTDECREISIHIKDSKKITPKKRAYLEEAIKTYAIDYSIGRVDANEIDTLGMTRANVLAFERAIEGLSVEPDRLLVDGLLQLNTSKEQIVEPQADNCYLAVAAASILAKEAHDRIVKDACEKETGLVEKYGLDTCKGYGTAKHRDGILKFGVHSDHRKLFLQKLLGGYGFSD